MPITLQIEQRDASRDADKVRAENKVPGVYYGKSEEATPIAIDRGTFERTWHRAGESTIVTLTDEQGETVDTLIHEVQQDPVTEAPIHVDFFAFERGKPIEVSVPIEFVGEAPAVKEQGGILVKVLHSMTVRALPKDLPPHVEVDVSPLAELNSQLTAKEITLPDGVELGEDPEEAVASIDVPQEEPEEPEEEMSVEDIEVEEKGKEESEESEGADEGSENAT